MSTLHEKQGGVPANPPSTMIQRVSAGNSFIGYPDYTLVESALQSLRPYRYVLADHVDCSPLPNPLPNTPGLHVSGEAVFRKLQAEAFLYDCFGLEDVPGLIALGKPVLVQCLSGLHRIYMWRSVARHNQDGTLFVPVLALERSRDGMIDNRCLRWQSLEREVSLVAAAARLRFSNVDRTRDE